MLGILCINLINQKTISACIEGDNKAQYELYKSLYTKHMGMCMRYRKNKDTATISFNNAFVKILSNLNKLKDIAVFDGWVKRIIINQMLTEISKETKEQQRTEVLDESFNYSLAAVYNKGSEKLNAEYLKKLLNQLPKTTQQVFNLFAIDGFSHKEIGGMLGISDGTSKWHVAEARKRLQLTLGQQKGKNAKLNAV